MNTQPPVSAGRFLLSVAQAALGWDLGREQVHGFELIAQVHLMREARTWPLNGPIIPPIPAPIPCTFDSLPLQSYLRS